MTATYPLFTSSCLTNRPFSTGPNSLRLASLNSLEWRPLGLTQERPQLQAAYVSTWPRLAWSGVQ